MGAVASCLRTIVSAIGAFFMAIINGIGSILMALVNGVAAICNGIITVRLSLPTSGITRRSRLTFMTYSASLAAPEDEGEAESKLDPCREAVRLRFKDRTGMTRVAIVRTHALKSSRPRPTRTATGQL